MSFLPLSLGVRRQPGAGGAAQKERSPDKKQTDKILSRDDYTCRCCGFVSKKFQRVMPDPSSNAGAGDDVAVCTFCEQCLALDRVSLTGGGVLIWLPEMTQADLNHVARALYIAKASDDGALSTAAGRALDTLTARRAEAKKRIGTDDPLILSTALTEAVDAKIYAARATKLEGIRLLVSNRYMVRQGGRNVDIYPQMQTYWTSYEGPFGKTPVSEWVKLFEDVAAKAG